MSIAVLLSIKPKFAFAIFAGEKIFEFRKILFRNPDIKKVFVYASAPTSRVIGYFHVDEILENHPTILWKETSHGAGISESFFNEYFAGRERGFALKVRQTELFDSPVKLIDMFGFKHPPQSFRYVPSATTN